MNESFRNLVEVNECKWIPLLRRELDVTGCGKSSEQELSIKPEVDSPGNEIVHAAVSAIK